MELKIICTLTQAAHYHVHRYERLDTRESSDVGSSYMGEQQLNLSGQSTFHIAALNHSDCVIGGYFKPVTQIHDLAVGRNYRLVCKSS